MIKSIVLGCGWILGSSCFSFYKMKEIYCDLSPYKATAKIERLCEWEKLEITDNISFFLYDEHTFTQLHSLYSLKLINIMRGNLKEDLNLSSPKTLGFLNCDFIFNKNFFYSETQREISLFNSV